MKTPKFITHAGIRLLALFVIIIFPVLIIWLRKDALFFYSNVLYVLKYPEKL